MFTLARILCRATRNAKPSTPQRRPRLSLEALEDRYVLSTLTVTSNADGFFVQPGTLRYAVENAASGDTILISPTLTNTPVLLNPVLGKLLINKDLTIEADGNAPATISGNNACRVFEIAINEHVTLSHLTLTNAVRSAIYNAGMLTISDCTQSENTAYAVPGFSGSGGNGGAILNFSGIVTISNSNLSGNSADSGGAIDNELGTMTISNSVLSGNSAAIDLGPGTGGGIANSGTLLITNSNLSYNQCWGSGAPSQGGGIYNSGTVTISNSKLSDNIAGLYGNGNGGGIYNSGKLRITNSTLSEKISGRFSFLAGEGGGIYNSSGTVIITNCILSGNSAIQNGGGIYNSSSGTVTITNSILSGNTAADDGGGIYNAGTLTLKNSTDLGNTASSGADLFTAVGSTLNQKNSVIGIIGP